MTTYIYREREYSTRSKYVITMIYIINIKLINYNNYDIYIYINMYIVMDFCYSKRNLIKPCCRQGAFNCSVEFAVVFNVIKFIATKE